MTGIVSQLIALTAYGNDYLQNGINATPLDAENEVFQFCNKVDFRYIKKPYFFSKPTEAVLVDTPSKWFQFLKDNGCKHLRLYFQGSQDDEFGPDHKLAGMVGGGGLWLIEAVYDTYSNFWANRWEVANQDAPDRKIWEVSYAMILEKAETVDLQIDNEGLKEKLERTLTEIGAFAQNHDLGSWAEIFDKAKVLLNSTTPEHNYYHENLIPVANYSLTARQILYAAGSAWVFGGMGSWNDIGFDQKEDEALYEKLSAQLYDDFNNSILAAINSY